jgi:hypothetical protein
MKKFPSFLKKRSKKLLSVLASASPDRHGQNGQLLHAMATSSDTANAVQKIPKSGQ